MTHVVVENCIKCKHTDCVKVCPVDCFYEGPNFLAINPDECIDCGVCIPECPVDAIKVDTDKEYPDLAYWLKLNKELASEWKVITKQKAPLPDAAEWKDVPNKRNMLER